MPLAFGDGSSGSGSSLRGSHPERRYFSQQVMPHNEMTDLPTEPDVLVADLGHDHFTLVAGDAYLAAPSFQASAPQGQDRAREP